MARKDIRFAARRAPREQLVLFAQRLDELVGPEAPVRVLVQLLEEVDWSPWEQAYAGFGQPPIHPRYLASAILFGLLHKVRSSRELERAARKDVDFMWLLEGFTPDHSTFAGFRVRHGEALRALQAHFAQALVRRREEATLRLLTDGTRLRADSDLHGARTAKAIARLIEELAQRQKVLEQGDALEGEPDTANTGKENRQALDHIDRELARLRQQRAKYERALEVARERDARARQRNGKQAKPTRVPVTDPDAQMTKNKDGGFAPNYTPVATVESQTGAIVHGDVLAGSDETSAIAPAVAAAQALTGQKPEAVLADSNFASGQVLADLDADGIEAYMPTRSMSPPDNPARRPEPTTPVAEPDRDRLPRHGKQLARTAFVYDPHTDVYYCPMGHALGVYKRGKGKDGTPCAYYRCTACPGCPMAKDCLQPKATYRSITRDAYEPLRQAAAERMSTPEGQAIYATRAPGIEGVFGHLKSSLQLRQFTLRGLDKVRIEWTWICTAYNVKKLLALYTAAPSNGFSPLFDRARAFSKRCTALRQQLRSAPFVQRTWSCIANTFRTLALPCVLRPAVL